MGDTSKQGFGGGGGTVPNRVYEDFDPNFEWIKEENFDTLLVYLPGFQKDKLKIQINSSGKLRLSGERLVSPNKWRRFLKEFPLLPDCDTNKVAAKFEGGILYVKVPKPVTTNPNPSPKPKATTFLAEHETPTPKQTPFPPTATSPRTTTTATSPRTTADQLGQKPPQKVAPKPASSPEKVEPKSDGAGAATSAASGSGEAEKGGKSGEMRGVGLVNRTASLIGGYKKVIVSQGSPRVLVNMLLAVLFIGVLALYAKNILIRSFGKSNGSDHHHHGHHDHHLEL